MNRVPVLLLIDDDQDDHEIFGLAIQQLPGTYYCEFGNSALEALNKLNSGSVKPDMIFLDLNMPGVNGFECLSQLKEIPSLATIPVIIITTSADMNLRTRASALGVKAFLTKATSIDILSQQLKEIFANYLD